MTHEEEVNISDRAHGYVGVFVIVPYPKLLCRCVGLTPFGGYGFLGIYINEYNTATAMFVWVEFHGNSFLSFG
jgi:hypothetical protein